MKTAYTILFLCVIGKAHAMCHIRDFVCDAAFQSIPFKVGTVVVASALVTACKSNTNYWNDEKHAAYCNYQKDSSKHFFQLASTKRTCLDHCATFINTALPPTLVLIGTTVDNSAVSSALIGAAVGFCLPHIIGASYRSPYRSCNDGLKTAAASVVAVWGMKKLYQMCF